MHAESHLGQYTPDTTVMIARNGVRRIRIVKNVLIPKGVVSGTSGLLISIRGRLLLNAGMHAEIRTGRSILRLIKQPVRPTAPSHGNGAYVQINSRVLQGTNYRVIVSWNGGAA
jgi:hypothetical protein